MGSVVVPSSTMRGKFMVQLVKGFSPNKNPCNLQNGGPLVKEDSSVNYLFGNVMTIFDLKK